MYIDVHPSLTGLSSIHKRTRSVPVGLLAQLVEWKRPLYRNKLHLSKLASFFFTTFPYHFQKVAYFATLKIFPFLQEVILTIPIATLTTLFMTALTIKTFDSHWVLRLLEITISRRCEPRLISEFKLILLFTARINDGGVSWQFQNIDPSSELFSILVWN